MAACGTGHMVALRADGTVRCWGRNDVNQCDVPPDFVNVVDIDAGGGHSVAILETPPPCEGDLDGNGVVGNGDLALMLAAWRAGGTTGDLDGNGVVSGTDLGILLDLWGPCESRGPVER
jgi:hypothetical protein